MCVQLSLPEESIPSLQESQPNFTDVERVLSTTGAQEQAISNPNIHAVAGEE